MTSSRAPATLSEELRTLLRLVGPLVAVYLGNQLLSVVDTAIVGRLSETSLAGTGLGSSVFFSIFVLGMGAMLGLDPIVTQAVGAEEHRTARTTLAQALWLAVLLSVPLAAVAGSVGSALHPLGIGEAVASEATHYLWGRSIGILPMLVLVGTRSYLQAYDLTWPLVVGMILANLLNVPLSWLLVFGDAALESAGLPGIGLPALGAGGAGITSSICALAQAAVAVAAARSMRRGREASRRWDGDIVRRALRLGIPIAFTLLAEVGSFALTTFFAGLLGQRPLAAHQVALMLASTSFQVALAIGIASTVRVGQAVGRGSTAGARRAGFLSFGVTLVFMGCSSLLFLLVPGSLAHLITDEPETIAAATGLVLVAAAFQIVDGLQINAAGALRGLGDTRTALIANVVGHYGFGQPLGLFLTFVLGWGASGLWWGLSLGLGTVAVVLLSRFAILTKREVQRV